MTTSTRIGNSLTNQLARDFNGHSEDERIVMGYLASNNSAYDVLRILIAHLQKNPLLWKEVVEHVKAAAEEINTEIGDGSDTIKVYLEYFKDLGTLEAINKPLV